MEKWLEPELAEGTIVHSYVAIRADEPNREGYQATHPNMHVHLPLREAGIDRKGVIDLLEQSAVGQPDYYQWRSRSGCTFCFFQQKIEWVRLHDHHPKEFEDAIAYEKSSQEHGSPFTWSQGERLEELVMPERRAQIEKDYEKRLLRLKAKQRRNPLAELLPDDINDVYGVAQDASCVMCHK